MPSPDSRWIMYAMPPSSSRLVHPHRRSVARRCTGTAGSSVGESEVDCVGDDLMRVEREEAVGPSQGGWFVTPDREVGETVGQEPPGHEDDIGGLHRREDDWDGSWVGRNGDSVCHGLGPCEKSAGGDQCQPHLHFPVPLNLCLDTGYRRYVGFLGLGILSPSPSLPSWDDPGPGSGLSRL